MLYQLVAFLLDYISIGELPLEPRISHCFFESSGKQLHEFSFSISRQVGPIKCVVKVRIVEYVLSDECRYDPVDNHRLEHFCEIQTK